MQKLFAEINQIDASIGAADQNRIGQPEYYTEAVQPLMRRKRIILEEIAHKRKMLTALLSEMMEEIDNCLRLGRKAAAYQLLTHSILLAAQIYEERTDRWEEIGEGLKTFHGTEGSDFLTEFSNIVFRPFN
jgi:hypothetical protein